MKQPTYPTRNPMRPVAVLAMAAIALVATLFVHTARAELTALPPAGVHFGKTDAQWGDAWWQWTLSIPTDVNPITDPTGRFGAIGQSGPVWFLAGNFGGTTIRTSTVPAGKGIFIPILNYAWVHTDPPDPTNLVGLLKFVEPGFSTPTNLFCTLDGVAMTGLTNYYFKSSSVFDVTVPENNLMGLAAGTYGPSASGGYGMTLMAPSPGTHTIHFGGRLYNDPKDTNDDFVLDVTYVIHVAKTPDLSKLVVVGDSLMAGYRDGGLVDVYQNSSIPALVARQAGVAFPQPLIGWPGINPVLEIKSAGPPPVIGPVSGTSTGRVDLTVQSQNLAVPGHTVADTLNTRPNVPVDSMTDLVLGLPGLLQGVSKSQVEWAEALKPTIILVWIGNNDALNAALAGDPAALTPESQFRTNYAALLDRLAATGATVAVGTIPDVAVIPYVQPVPNLAALLGVPAAIFQQALGVQASDRIILDGLADVSDILQQKKAGPLKASYVLTATEIEAIRVATTNFNAIIADNANRTGALLVDTHAFLNRLVAHGADAGQRHITTAFLGGIFSLDGIHVTSDGAAAVANQFIFQLNQSQAAIAPIASLNTHVDGSDLVIKWPFEAEGCVLESSPRLAPAAWQSLGNGVVNANGDRELRVSRNQAAAFFRLHYLGTVATPSGP